ncbi:NADH-ubiquinone oxidoreductase-F iron-sulfur binding region domain-containing protein [Arhodomonas sp. AD133]|uniref:NADH-ubiquinone oxidoreductase-F iron-sulfur binding region domain-containing protein n=1 Tax=Arhodomonas sp. AD133 TaxID=3415009 RepID=UPI003EB7236E
MDLLRRMAAIQHAKGAVDDAALRHLAAETGTPLYRLEGLRGFYPTFRESPGPSRRVRVCRDVVCRLRGGADHCDRVRAALAGYDNVAVEEVSCLGQCDRAPAVSLDDEPVNGAPRAVAALIANDESATANDARPGPPWPTDPYRDASERYATLAWLLGDAGDTAGREARIETVIATLDEVKLAGLGGAAFPTGKKWAFTRAAAGEEKYVVCNADESEPGTFKDRAILEDQPHLVIEGMAMGAAVIGARRGIIYLRHEYTRARRALQAALGNAYDRGVLGADSASGFDVELFVSPGGYILGEETALLEALEDRRGEPRNKPPFPTNVGLYGKPTLINNVETLAAVPAIVARGADWWRNQGRGGHTGLKYVSVCGDVTRPGVYCVPWGTPVSEILAEAGGMADGRALRAFSPGGASTPFLPAEKMHTPLDFAALREAGSGLGTGALVFVGEGRDLVDVALAQVRFFRNESCGKCVPCRIGSHKAVEMVEAVLDTEGSELGDELKRLNATLARTSICGLGQVALLPLVDLFEKFPDAPEVRRLRGETA